MRLVFAIILVFVIIAPIFSQESSQEGDDWYQGKPIRRIVFEGLNHVKV